MIPHFISMPQDYNTIYKNIQANWAELTLLHVSSNRLRMVSSVDSLLGWDDTQTNTYSSFRHQFRIWCGWRHPSTYRRWLAHSPASDSVPAARPVPTCWVPRSSCVWCWHPFLLSRLAPTWYHRGGGVGRSIFLFSTHTTSKHEFNCSMFSLHVRAS